MKAWENEWNVAKTVDSDSRFEFPVHRLFKKSANYSLQLSQNVSMNKFPG